MLFNKLHRTIISLIKKHYTVEFYNDNNHCIILSFYHLNSVYNGLCYIGKNSDYIRIDFQYHRYNKTVEKQLLYLCSTIQKLYKLKQLEQVKTILENYQPLAKEIYNKNYSLNKVEA